MNFEIQREMRPENAQPLERAVYAFIKETEEELRADPIGFFNQTVESIVANVVRPGVGDFWLAVDDAGEVAAYALGHITKDIDNRLTYWLSQAYVAPKYRRTPFVKECFEKMRAHAKTNFCKHIVVVSSRGADAYCRFLGPTWHPYAQLLKEDL